MAIFSQTSTAENPQLESSKDFFKYLWDYRTIGASNYRSDPGISDTQRCYDIKGTHPGSVRMFRIVNNDDTSLNILLNFVYYKDRKKCFKANVILYIY